MERKESLSKSKEERKYENEVLFTKNDYEENIFNFSVDFHEIKLDLNFKNSRDNNSSSNSPKSNINPILIGGNTNIKNSNNNIENPDRINKPELINNFQNNIYMDNKNNNKSINKINDNYINNNQIINIHPIRNQFYENLDNRRNFINAREINKKQYFQIKERIKYFVHNINIILNLLSNYRGSVFLQKSLLNMNSIEISILFRTIYPYICKIMCLDFGNYFIQKLIKYLNIQEKLSIYQIIEKDFLNIATDRRGTHSIQALIDSIQNPLEHFYLYKLLSKNMLLLFNNENGYHIMMKLIMETNENQRNILNFFFVTNIDKIIINPYGAYCGNKFLIYNSNLELRALLIDNIKNNIKKLIFNKYSSCFILLSIKKFGINSFEFIIEEINNNLVFLSLHPISNLLVCRIFNYLKEIEYNKLNSIIWIIFENDKLVKDLISNQNGNILLKKIMECCDNTQRIHIKAKLNI